MNKLLKTFILAMLMLSATYSQNTLSFTLVAGDTITNVLKIPNGEIPIAIYCDSLTSAATITPYIWIGDTSGISKQNYLQLTTAGTSTVSTISLSAKRFTPLNWDIYHGLIGNSLTKAQYVWVFLDFAATQTFNKIIKVRTAQP